MIRRLMVPNRGEIAARIARTAREMKIHTILAHSDPDSGSHARRAFDEMIPLGPGHARETYLNVAAVIDAARACRADAIHPGYGFLSERAALAEACRDAGIVFVGPGPESIEKMGSKAGARTLMERLGVPVVPGYHGDDQSDAAMASAAERIGFPLLVKASGGGGGKGMKIVRESSAVLEAVESARREALKAFGDDRLLLERYIEDPRHVEFQVFGDRSGEVVHLFERDCSIQRRHQKVVEESPAPRYPETLRAAMAEAALAAARGVDYENAGTVEFIVTPAGEFYFLEMNTRLQVEHPVTELVLGVDLVRAQLLVASGENLPWRQEDLVQRGHAIEVRVYAEDPANQFLPQTGTIRVYREPEGPGIRIDSGVAAESEIPVQYDPMMAKVIAFAESRPASIDRLARALSEYVVLGTTTNIGYLRRIIEHPEFREGNVSTSFLARHEEELASTQPDELAAIAAVLSASAKKSTSSPSPEKERSASVWQTIGSL